MGAQHQDILLEVKDLKVQFTNNGETITAVDKIGFTLTRGQSLGIVGESGSGKSVTSLSILNLLQSNPANTTEGSVMYHNDDGALDMIRAPVKILHRVRGRRISVVFQEPMSSLNPVRKCGSQVKEILDVHDLGPSDQRKDYILELFRQVALPDVERIYDSYPHELSGGQLQRINIAMALATKPDIVICDEPTTALDVTVQKQILVLLGEMMKSHQITLIFVSHDLDVVAGICDSVVVMYKGEIVEKGPLPATFTHPKHPYTKALITCKPTAENRNYVLPTVKDIVQDQFQYVERRIKSVEDAPPLIEVNNLKVYFPKRKSSLFGPRSHIKAVDGVTLTLRKGQILGLVGESGSGKSTVANCIAGLITPTAGEIKYEGSPLTPTVLARDKTLRTKIQLVFQDPYSSLNPRMTIGDAIKEPLKYHKIVPGAEVQVRLNDLLNQVGLDQSYADRYPHQLSGGQRQRACIARALSVDPDVLICDESVSALDVSVQAQILNLLDRLRSDLGVSMVFISHDLAVIHYICDYVIVMKDGQIKEEGNSVSIMKSPQSQYTRELIDSLPRSIV